MTALGCSLPALLLLSTVEAPRGGAWVAGSAAVSSYSPANRPQETALLSPSEVDSEDGSLFEVAVGIPFANTATLVATGQRLYGESADSPQAWAGHLAVLFRHVSASGPEYGVQIGGGLLSLDSEIEGQRLSGQTSLVDVRFLSAFALPPVGHLVLHAGARHASVHEATLGGSAVQYGGPSFSGFFAGLGLRVAIPALTPSASAARARGRPASPD
jgi:hypothetical protein